MVTLSWVVGTSANLGIRGQCKDKEGQSDLWGPDPWFLAFCGWINIGFSLSWPVGQI